MELHAELRFIEEIQKHPVIYESLDATEQSNNGDIERAFQDVAEKFQEFATDSVQRWELLKQKYNKLKSMDQNQNANVLQKNEKFMEKMGKLEAISKTRLCSTVEILEGQDHDQDGSMLESQNEYIVEEQDKDAEESNVENYFIEEVKKYPVLFNVHDPDYKKTKLKNSIWETIGKKFGEDEKKLLLKWKNLKRKYILMRYPQSSKNHITQKRRVKYSQRFIDKMSFLDPFLEYASLYEPVTDNSYYETEAKRIKLEQSVYTQITKVIPSPKTPKIVPKKPRKSTPLKIETLHPAPDSEDEVIEIPSIEIHDDEEEEVVQNHSFHGEIDYLNQDQTYESDGQAEQSIPNCHTSMRDFREMRDMRHDVASVESEDRRAQYSNNEYFCLSLVESLNGLSQRKQNYVKEKFWRVINEAYNS